MPSRESSRVAKPADRPITSRLGGEQDQRVIDALSAAAMYSLSRLTSSGCRWWHEPSFLLRPHVRPLDKPLSWNQYLDYFKYGGHFYPFIPATTLESGRSRRSPPSRATHRRGTSPTGSSSLACWRGCTSSPRRASSSGRCARATGEVLQHGSAPILEHPWPNATTGDLLARAIQDVDLAGNFYCARRGARIRRMRPDWVTIVMGSELDGEDAASDLDAEVVGYVYKPGGQRASTRGSSSSRTRYATSRRSPTRARFRGMSWLTPIIPELMADSAATQHKLKFFENGATPNMVVSTAAPMSPDAFNEWVKNMQDSTERC